MYLGKIAEVTTREDLFGQPLHPYTRALMSAIPVPDPERKKERVILTGDVPSPLNPPSGCRFHPRCPIARLQHCSTNEPQLRELQPNHWVACHYAEDYL
jgi:oligopeptide/dipeptide ABC transporter ATP-binding protein